MADALFDHESGGDVLLQQPQVSESDAALPYINTSADAYKPQSMTFSEIIPADSDAGGVLFIDTARREALVRRLTSNDDNWRGATGMLSGSWLPLLPGQNHIVFSTPETSTASWPVKITLDDEAIV